MLDVYYDPKYTASDHAFDTTRKADWIAQALIVGSVPGVHLLAPESDISGYLESIHDYAYLNAVMTGTPRDLAQSQGFPWDPGIHTMASAHTSGLVEAARQVMWNHDQLSGSLSSGLHHASHGSGGGFCTYNGLAAAALAARDEGAESVLVLDFDAHCGGGTADIARTLGWDWFRQIDVSTSGFDQYVPDAQCQLFMSASYTYLEDIDLALQVAQEGDWDLVIYNAGMDPYDSGVTAIELIQREAMVAKFVAERRAIFALAGGYLSEPYYVHDVETGEETMLYPGLDQGQLVDLHLETMRQWIEVVG